MSDDNVKRCFKVFKMKGSTLDTISCFLAELIGTGILVFLGCMGCVKSDLFPNNHLQMVLNFGFAVLIAIQCFGCVSGSHFNPAVTVAAYIYDLVSWHMALLYFVAQLLGAFIGYGLLITLIPDSVKGIGAGLCVTLPHPQISSPQAFGIEFTATAILIIVCCGVWDPRNAKHHDSVAIRFGLAVACLACAAGPFTGASMNPARSFAPALWNKNFDSHWIYWLAPLSGAAVTAIAYKAVFRREVVEAQVTSDEKLRQLEDVQLS
ncbi:aquaporin AQPcic isoform X1 [Drosophila sulfurigaster albostrigata]|uniref:Aquaporin AQPcic isoform X1 n=2 Tax=Drosophila albomicans TaxID=7291 RepID=A0A9C6T4Z1_DROAB|nr:aquaporin AQPcic isoform X1 [Drosophila albomicans]XP_062136882.1 aquaporin AQPcic isoform X1 [Drosophila sulfurigaster albostrigata]